MALPLPERWTPSDIAKRHGISVEHVNELIRTKQLIAEQRARLIWRAGQDRRNSFSIGQGLTYVTLPNLLAFEKRHNLSVGKPSPVHVRRTRYLYGCKDERS